MFKTRPRFRPALDALPRRVALTGGFDTWPMDPTLDPWEPPRLPAETSPLDPTLDPAELPNVDWLDDEPLGDGDQGAPDGTGGDGEPRDEVVRCVDAVLEEATVA